VRRACGSAGAHSQAAAVRDKNIQHCCAIDSHHKRNHSQFLVFSTSGCTPAETVIDMALPPGRHALRQRRG